MSAFEGSITALVTPFRNGSVDAAAFARLVERQIAGGTQGLVPCGSTGEAPTLTDAEHEQLVRLCAETAKKRVPVIAGVGSNATTRAIALARIAEQAGADALLAAAGYYNKPSEAGLIAHFTALHDATRLPILLYNVPGRTIVDLKPGTIGALAKLPRIVGLKDATGDLARVALHRLVCPRAFTLLSGEDATAVGFNAMGGRGCISVAANVAPETCARLQAATLKGDYAAALDAQDKLAALTDALFKDPNPGPVKYALSLLGLCTEELRLPLVPPPPAVRDLVRAALAGLGLISR
jgi:4-hydroxy-tetrahydrodipicolinate synthase